MESLEHAYRSLTATPRFAAALMGVFSLLALLLSAVGIYGVMAFTVGERTPEIALRRALGAGTGAVARTVVIEALRLAVLGLILGGAVAWFGVRVLETFLFQVAPDDPLTFAGVAAVMLAVSLAAASIPTWRGRRQEPLGGLERGVARRYPTPPQGKIPIAAAAALSSLGGRWGTPDGCPPVPSPRFRMREFIDGAEAIARAAIHSGCDFFAGYPITPATPILVHMMRELPKVGGVAIQGEDEIASMGFCIGAAMSGARVMTATSGPGISLYSESVGLAIMGEVPMVIIDAQRMGPATGGATTVAQGDVQFLRWGTSGGYPVIVLAPTDVAECYSLTRKAFDLAERFRVPVFVATDKETVLSRATVEVSAWNPVPVRPRATAPADEPFVPYPAGSPLGRALPCPPSGGRT